MGITRGGKPKIWVKGSEEKRGKYRWTVRMRTKKRVRGKKED